VKRTVISAAVLALLAGGASAAVAGPGPNGNNTFGLCTAYFAGSEKGQEKKRQAPPFQGLEKAAEEADQTVEEYCAENGTQPGNGGGNRP
jgi:opacity protein-like surface antigen